MHTQSLAVDGEGRAEARVRWRRGGAAHEVHPPATPTIPTRRPVAAMPTPKRPTPQPALFDGDTSISDDTTGAPLAARLRPRNFDDYVGQEHLVGPSKLLRRLVEYGQLPSIILWGPPGSGKTTLARIIARHSDAHFVHSPPYPPVSPTSVASWPKPAPAKSPPPAASDADPATTVLFIDEIHRFNKAQQDAVLPYVEDGTVTLIGATTENPSFEVIGPLLSRSRVFTLKALEETQSPSSSDAPSTTPTTASVALNVRIDDDALEALAASVGGDARIALNALEAAAMSVAHPARARTNHDGVALDSGALAPLRSRRGGRPGERFPVRHSPARSSKRPCSTAPTSTTARATPTTTQSAPSSKACAAQTPTPPSTGSPA